MALPSAQKKDKHPIPDPVQFLQSHSETNGARGPTNPMSPGQSGKTMPTQATGAPQGFSSSGKKGEPQGNKGQHKRKGTVKLAPNNQSKAKTMVGGKKPFNMPTNNSIVRRLNPPMGQSTAGSAAGQKRNGVLSRFAGFGPSSC